MGKLLISIISGGFMIEQSLRILQVNVADIRGGVESVAWNLLHGLRVRGCDSQMVVKFKVSDNPNVLTIPDGINPFYIALQGKLKRLAARFPGSGFGRLSKLFRMLAHPRVFIDDYLGMDDFSFPSTYQILKLLPLQPDILHCHNLLKYFDLRALPWLSRQVKVVLTLHDAWLLSGHCVHSFDCDRWKTVCGDCPDLTIYPAIRRDATAYNFRRKKEIYANSKLYVVTPSQWLMEKVEQSILAPGIVKARVIPNSVDLSVFHPAEQQIARSTLGIPQNAKVLLFTAASGIGEIFKDYNTLRVAVTKVAQRLSRDKIVFIVLGDNSPTEQISNAQVSYIPFQSNPKMVARYYQAADIYIHAARADTFPSAILEALACGIPVVATAVSGIPEQVKSLKLNRKNITWQTYDQNQATGALTPVRDSETLAEALIFLISNDELRKQLGKNAFNDAKQRFTLEHQVEEYLEWYYTILDEKRKTAPTATLYEI